jgi:nucleotide-binding universal stress UspA family protein
VALDGSELSKRALPAAMELADSLSAELLLVQAVEIHPPMYGDPSAYVMVDPSIELESAETRLERLATELRSGGRTIAVAEMLGFAVTSVIDITRERGIDIIVMSTHGSGGLTRLIMGSVATGIIQRSNVPVLVVRPPSTAS